MIARTESEALSAVVQDALHGHCSSRILECALAGRAECIVTGDRAMLALGEFRGIRIVTLSRYLE